MRQVLKPARRAAHPKWRQPRLQRSTFCRPNLVVAHISAPKGTTTDPRLVLEPARGATPYGTINDSKQVNFGYEPSEIAGQLADIVLQIACNPQHQQHYVMPDQITQLPKTQYLQGSYSYDRSETSFGNMTTSTIQRHDKQYNTIICLQSTQLKRRLDRQ